MPGRGERVAFKRFKSPDGAEFTADEVAGKSMGLEPLDKPAVDRNGRPLAVKPSTTKAGQPKVSASPKNNDKES